MGASSSSNNNRRKSSQPQPAKGGYPTPTAQQAQYPGEPQQSGYPGPPPPYNPTVQPAPYNQQQPAPYQPQQQRDSIGGVFDQGARFHPDKPVNIPPPPPGCAPTAAQAAIAQGQPVVMNHQKRDVWGVGSDGGYTVW